LNNLVLGSRRGDDILEIRKRLCLHDDISANIVSSRLFEFHQSVCQATQTYQESPSNYRDHYYGPKWKWNLSRALCLTHSYQRHQAILLLLTRWCTWFYLFILSVLKLWISRLINGNSILCLSWPVLRDLFRFWPGHNGLLLLFLSRFWNWHDNNLWSRSCRIWWLDWLSDRLNNHTNYRWSISRASLLINYIPIRFFWLNNFYFLDSNNICLRSVGIFTNFDNSIGRYLTSRNDCWVNKLDNRTRATFYNKVHCPARLVFLVFLDNPSCCRGKEFSIRI